MLQTVQPTSATPEAGRASFVIQRWESARRYYVLILAPNLFGEWELIQAWGGKGNRLGRLRALPVADYADGLAALHRVGRVRERRGYRVVQTRVL